MSKKQWLIILIIAVLAGVLFGYFQDRFSNTSSPESPKEEFQSEKSFETIKLEKPPFLK